MSRRGIPIWQAKQKDPHGGATVVPWGGGGWRCPARNFAGFAGEPRRNRAASVGLGKRARVSLILGKRLRVGVGASKMGPIKGQGWAGSSVSTLEDL